MGLGLAAPYLLVAAAPRLAGALPRPGRWFGVLRAILGFALAGTAVWLLFVLAALSGPGVALGSGAALATVLGLLMVKTRYPIPVPAARLASAAAAIIVVGSVLWPAFAGIEPARPPAAAGPWRRFDPAVVPRLVADGKVVFVDVSAAWCLTCKVNEAAVLDRAPVAGRLFGGKGRRDARRLDATRSGADPFSPKLRPLRHPVRCGLWAGPTRRRGAARTALGLGRNAGARPRRPRSEAGRFGRSN